MVCFGRDRPLGPGGGGVSRRSNPTGLLAKRDSPPHWSPDRVVTFAISARGGGDITEFLSKRAALRRVWGGAKSAYFGAAARPALEERAARRRVRLSEIARGRRRVRLSAKARGAAARPAL